MRKPIGISLNMSEIKALSRKAKAQEYYRWQLSLMERVVNNPPTEKMIPEAVIRDKVAKAKRKAIKKELRKLKPKARDPELVRNIIRDRFKKD